MPTPTYIPGLGIPSDLVFGALGVPSPQSDTPATPFAPDVPAVPDAVSSAAPVAPSAKPSQALLDYLGPEVGPDNQPLTTSVGVGSSHSGFNPGTNDVIQKRAKGPGGIQGQLADISARQEQALGDVNASAEKQAQLGAQAVQAETTAEQDKILAQGRENSALAEMNQKFVIEESRQSALAAQKTDQYMANYEASLEDFRAAKVDPGKLWHDMSGGQRFGMLASAFVHDFLGVKGIHTSVMDTFNRAMDQSINAQVENIKNKREAAEGFKSLLEMSQAQSRTEAESRLRVRGYMLTAFQDKIAGELAGYDSNLAAAKGQAALAAVQGELVKTKGELAKIWNENANADKHAAVQVYGDQLKASMEQARLNAEFGQKKVDQQRIDKLNALAIQDPETGNHLGFAHTEDEANKIREKLGENYAAIKELLAYEAQIEKVKSHYGGAWASKLIDADTAILEQLRLNAIAGLEREKGGTRAASSPGIMDRYEKALQSATWANRQGYEKAVGTAASVAQSARQDALGPLGAILTHGKADDEALIRPGVPQDTNVIGENAGPATGYAAGAATVANALRNTKGKVAESEVATVAKDVQSASGEDRDNPTQHQAEEYQQFRRAHPSDNKFDQINQRVEQGAANPGLVSVPHWGTAMMHLQDIATPNKLSPDAFIKSLPDTFTPEERRMAREKLVEFAHGGGSEKDGTAITGDQILFAQYLLSELEQRGVK